MTGAAIGANSVLSGRYRLVQPLASGGMGTVWHAVDLLLDRPVAVKEVRLPPGLDDAALDTLRRRTIREAQIAARLRHPAIVTIYDVVEHDGRPWIVMELVRSRSLAEIIRTRGPLPPVRAAGIALRVLDAMVTAQAAGVQHRDIKPSNVLVTDEGRVVLTDFGIARHVGDETLTSAGLLVGSPDYLAPERARGHPSPGLAADLWSLGVTLYEAVEGRRPFERAGALPTLAAIVMDEPEPPLRAGPLQPVIDGLLVKDPRHRLDADRTRDMVARVVRARPAGATVPLPREAVEDGMKADAGAGLRADTGSPDAAGPIEAVDARPAGTTDPARTARADGSVEATGVAGSTGPQASRNATDSNDGDGHGAGASTEPAAPDRDRRHAVLIGLVVAVLVGVAAVALPRAFSADPADQAGPPPAGASAATAPATASAATTSDPAPSRSTTASPTTTAAIPRPTTPPATGAQLAAPAGFARYTDPRDGFSVIVPAGWRPVRRDTRVDFDEPGTSRFLRIDTSDTPLADPYQNWVDYEGSYRQGKADYRNLGIRRVPGYRAGEGWNTADWEFTLGGTHVLDRNIRVSSARAHAIYWSTPASQWTTADSRQIFDLAAASFVPAPPGR
jgi:tRNA A-37 threonylcarbamoyl transferase component Bud32